MSPPVVGGMASTAQGCAQSTRPHGQMKHGGGKTMSMPPACSVSLSSMHALQAALLEDLMMALK